MKNTKTNSNVQIFDFADKQLRVIEQNGEPWFVAVDVCRMLGIQVQSNGTVNVTVALRNLDKKEITLYSIQGNGGSRKTNLISESGLYKLIMRSDKPQAKPFQDWVTKVVLPAIRKDGGYIMGEEKVPTGEMSEDELVSKASRDYE